ncbi:MAG: DUF1697 domain-containing protein [Planctomycetes bacterium]|nr:DUF1697 domain-containing protein [Planctomycetota bacterium]
MIALLRAINVAGRNKVPMANLRKMFEALGFASVQTLLQTGNVAFVGKATEAQLEAELKKRLDVETEFILRSDAEWTKLIAANPFPQMATDDPGHLVVMFMKQAPGPAEMKALQAAVKGNETVKAVGKQVYACYPDGIGRSKLTVALIEKKLGIRGTGRNWNTAMKLAKLASLAGA